MPESPAYNPNPICTKTDTNPKPTNANMDPKPNPADPTSPYPIWMFGKKCIPFCKDS